MLVGSVRHGGSLWRLSDGQRLYDWNHQAEGLSVLSATALAANGRFAATAEGRQLTLWDCGTGQALGSWLLDGAIQSLAVSDDGRRKLRMHPKGSFIYRLAGRDREKSASYYTPESLTQCLVKYALKELLPGKTAADRKAFQAFLDTLAYPCVEESRNPVYQLFLR